MLAVPAEPFDSPEYLFEVKWDGVRALAACEATGWRMWGREATDYSGRYPELDRLRRLPAGTLLDGEVILCQHGRPQLRSLLSRHQLIRPAQIEAASRVHPVSYVVFDILAHRGRMLLAHPLQARREMLQELLDRLQEPRLVFSAGVVGAGRRFFVEAVRQGQEGVMAKHLASRYRPGRRSAAWKKIKPAFRARLVGSSFDAPGSPQRLP
jgi:ATP-dependent DNA ligase